MDYRIAEERDQDLVRAFYDHVIDEMADAEYFPMWEKDVYPTYADLRALVDSGQMVLGELGGRLVACAVLNQVQGEGYDQATWPSGAADEDVAVIHLLCVDPREQGKGLAHQLVAHLASMARERGRRVVRLDVLDGNLPAMRLYEGCGFSYVGAVPLFYEDTGRMDFHLFELAL